MIDEITRKRLYSQAFSLLAEIQDLLSAARAKHEQTTAGVQKKVA